MSFSPVVPFSGYSGWAFLKRTLPEQKEAFQASATLARDEDYFRAKIGSIQTAEDLVSDHRLLTVALGAFGLDDDINNRFFIKKVLKDGTLDSSALGNKLADKQYLALSASFGFGDSAIPSTQNPGFADEILTAYQDRQFETAVGEQDENLRFALNAERELAVLASRDSSEDTKWFTVMGNEPLRQVFEKALGLPSSFATLDLDMQLKTLKAKTEKAFGDSSVAQFSDPANLDDLVKKFLIRSEAMASFSSTSGASIALTLLQG
ncbi:DUF1217 domain-containing protein [Pseudorhodobacter turbinis]|uniref:DUF1217 domain-containing protein n=1 Tax=Pseudorhodobacter turbinis TaxID=2500533 RepID=A0A4P8EE74_9RHOB|nr:DUF1217 domain-containing protein [Pseudorhodobacter turbinis]QCO55320.1 DUF1217 domain-containing protein [Pseudorhodobacter turbinis]